MVTPGQRFDAAMFAALDVATDAQADAIAREFPALWAQWAQAPAVVERVLAGPRAVPAGKRASMHPPWCDLLSEHAPPFECEPAVPFPPGLDPGEIHHHSEDGPKGCPRCDLARSFPLEAAEAIEARLAAEPHAHDVSGPALCHHCRVVRATVRGTP